MQRIILGMKIGTKANAAFVDYAPLFKCEYQRVRREVDIVKIAKATEEPIILVVDISKEPKEKYEMCDRLRKYDNIYMMFLSSNIDPDERLRWISFGVSTYIPKPFRPEEMLWKAKNYFDFYEQMTK